MRLHSRRWLGVTAVVVLAAACAAPSDGESPAMRDAPTLAPPSVAASEPPRSAGPTPGASDASDDPTPSATQVAFDDALLAIELRDVRTGEAFTLGELAADAPVIVETMAIWCTNCKQQMHEVTAAHELADFHSVSIDVDPTEFAEDLVAYAEREGFDWPFVLA